MSQRTAAWNRVGLGPAALLILVLVSACVWPSPANSGQGQPDTQMLEEAVRTKAVERIAELILQNYFDEAAARKCADHLKARLTAGAYSSLRTPSGFASSLTRELREVCNDSHFEVVLRPAERPQPAPPQDPNAWIEDLRVRNFDFVHVTRLPGNVGLLQLNSFPPPAVAGPTAEAAMAFLSSSDAVILDLRQNSGGTGDMVNLLGTYFFEQRTLLSTTYRRVNNRTTENWTLPYVSGRRLPTVDLFILTSSATFSAAEAMAYPLQVLGRATIVGEVTRGGGNPGRYLRVDDLFDVFVPVGTTTVPPAGTTWDKAGIKPDLEVSAAKALDLAHLEALSRLTGKAKSPSRRKEIEWLLEWKRAEVAGAGQLEESHGAWVGVYGEGSGQRRIRWGFPGALYHRVDQGPERRLLPISPSVFLVEGAEWVRLEFSFAKGSGRQLAAEDSSGTRDIYKARN